MLQSVNIIFSRLLQKVTSMKLSIFNRAFFLMMFCCLCTSVMAGNLYEPENEDSSDVVSKYDKRIHRYRKNWGALVPTQNVIQFFGNIGLVSIGVGWDYGKHRQWETEIGRAHV